MNESERPLYELTAVVQLMVGFGSSPKEPTGSSPSVLGRLSSPVRPRSAWNQDAYQLNVYDYVLFTPKKKNCLITPITYDLLSFYFRVLIQLGNDS